MAAIPVGEPVAVDQPLHLDSWSSDGSALQARFFTGTDWQHQLVPVDGGSIPFPGQPFWVEGGLVLHRRASHADHLLLADQAGVVRLILQGAGRITQVAVSPDRRHIAYLRSTGGSVYHLVLLSPQRLAPATPVELGSGVRMLTWLEAPDPGGGALLITDTAGRELLSRYSGALEVVGLREVGATYPILPVMVAGGGSMGMHYEAYLYDPSTARLERIPWGNTDVVVSRSGVVQVEGGVQTTHWETDGQGGWRERTVIWRYRNGALRPVAP